MKIEIERLKNLLTSPLRVVILTHTRLDGDAIASLLSLCVSLDLAGYEVTGILPDGVPRRYRFLPGLDQLKTNFPDDADLIIAVDCAEYKRLSLPSKMLPPKVDVNIDHHSSNSFYASINIVDKKAASTTQVLFEILTALEFPINHIVATHLLTGLVTDTIGFRTDNVNPDVLRLAARLQEIGAPLADIQLHALNERSFAALQYWGCGLSRISQENGVVWTMLKQQDREMTGYSGFDDADLINLLSTVEGTRIAVILLEQPGGKVKVSWRSKSGINVSHLAESFGGGGHDVAAGAMIEGGVDEVSRAVLSATFDAMKKQVEPRT